MTVSTRMQAPNYKIYEPDALDAIYAKGLISDPIMGGISGAMGLMHQLKSGLSQQKYEGQQIDYNRMARDLDALEMEHKTRQEAMKLGAGLIKEGEDATNVRGSEMYLNDPGRSQVGGLARAVSSSKIAAQSAAASADRSKDADKTTIKVMEPPSPGYPQGREVITESKRKPDSAVPIAQPPARNNGQDQIKARILAVTGDNPKGVSNGDGTVTFTGPKGTIRVDGRGNEARK